VRTRGLLLSEYLLKNDRKMADVIDYILENMETGFVVLDQSLDALACNRRARIFLKKFDLPPDVRDVARRMLNAEAVSTFEQLFPGEVSLKKKLKGSPSNWTFWLNLFRGSKPYIVIFIVEHAFSDTVDLNAERRKFRLTRRETDVLRRVVNGMTNDEIAEDLGISEQTIKDHLSRIYEKFEVGSKLELLNYLINRNSRESDADQSGNNQLLN
jgi:DNA-binding CsgD family transcriptional regulator